MIWHTLKAVVLETIRIARFRKIRLAGKLATIATIPSAVGVVVFCAAESYTARDITCTVFIIALTVQI